MKQVTIKDIATECGLSVSTVSRALNNHPDINSDTKKIVNRLAKTLGYRPNIVARSLKSQHSNQIGVIVPEIRHNFFAKAISGIEDIACQKGYTVIISQSNEDVEREISNLNSMYLNRVAGVIMSVSASTNNNKHFKYFLNNGFKMVFFDRVPENLDVYSVAIDDIKCSYEGVKYLIDKGYRRICHLAGPQHLSICVKRRKGYEKALRDNKLEENIIIMEDGIQEINGYNSMDILLKRKPIPDAIFTVNGPVAFGAFKRLKEAKIKIPDEVAILGFSNDPIVELVDPPLTTIVQPSIEMGRQAAKLLIDQIEGNVIEMESKKLLLDYELRIRSST